MHRHLVSAPTPTPRSVPTLLSDRPHYPCRSDFVLTAGDSFEAGDLMAVVRSMSGEKLAEVRADYSGFLVSWSGGVAFQAGSSLGSCGLPDGLPMVVNCECGNGLSPRCRLKQTVCCRQTMTLSAASCSGTEVLAAYI